MFCGDKELRIIIISKLTIMIFSLSLTIVITKTQTQEGVQIVIRIKIWTNLIEQILNMEIILKLGEIRSSFLIIVTVVTTIVLLYSENYIENYNNKKFTMMIISFFASIITLCTRSSYVMLIIGWEILGLTSLMLIIFYPNKTSEFNSILTMIFNRGGDVLLIFVLGHTIINLCNNLITSEIRKEKILILLVCRITKRAQVPLSSWLPAAISAPTPISAIVHSSTLVTAGVYLMIRFKEKIDLEELRELLAIVRCTRFLIGGLMAIKEKDYKKIVAFSTIRQIRIIIIITTIKTLQVSITHIFYHAIFKTLIFCTVGVMFIRAWSDQKNRKMSLKSKEKLKNNILTIIVFSISGLVYSVSFFTKDIILEINYSYEKKFNIEILLTTACILTIIYCIKIMSVRINVTKSKTFYWKLYKSKIILIVSIIILAIEKLIVANLTKQFNPEITSIEVALIFFTLRILPFILYYRKRLKKPTFASLDIIHIKYFTYSNFKNTISNRISKNFSMSDLLFMKKITLKINQIRKEKTSYFLFLSTIARLIIFYSNSLRNKTLKMFRNRNKS